MSEILPVTTATDAVAAIQALGAGTPITRLLMLAREHGALAAVVDDGSPSPEWQEECQLLQGLGELPTEPLKRVRFVALPADQLGTVPEDVVDRAVVGEALLRPGPGQTVALGMVAPGPRGERVYVPCRPADPSGRPGAVPFMQQEGRVAVCAHASIWTVTNALQRRFPSSEVIGPRRIQDALDAISSPQAAQPSTGLTSSDVKAIFDRYGYDVRVLTFFNQRGPDGDAPLADVTVYRYVESGLPVYLSIDTEQAGHSLVILGHSFDPDAWWPGAQSGYYPTTRQSLQWIPSALWVPDYCCHDDNFGPYLSLSRGSIRRRARAMIVPIPRHLGIALYPDEAEIIAAGTIVALLRPDYSDARHWLASEVRLWAANNQLVLRTVLLEHADLVSHLRAAAYAEPIREALVKSLDGEDRAWCIEISSPMLFGPGIKYGEIILSATKPATTPILESLIAAHVPGYALARDAGTFVELWEPSDQVTAVMRR